MALPYLLLPLPPLELPNAICDTLESETAKLRLSSVLVRVNHACQGEEEGWEWLEEGGSSSEDAGGNSPFKVQVRSSVRPPSPPPAGWEPHCGSSAGARKS